MINSIKYRSLALILTLVFCLFSIGIPVVIASCPMMKVSVRGACCPEQTTKNLPIVKGPQDYSCCVTIIAAERNTNEYVQTQGYTSNTDKHYSITPILHYSIENNLRIASHKIFDNIHSPPLIEDIPIFTSSLLI